MTWKNNKKKKKKKKGNNSRKAAAAAGVPRTKKGTITQFFAKAVAKPPPSSSVAKPPPNSTVATAGRTNSVSATTADSNSDRGAGAHALSSRNKNNSGAFSARKSKTPTPATFSSDGPSERNNVTCSPLAHSVGFPTSPDGLEDRISSAAIFDSPPRKKRRSAESATPLTPSTKANILQQEAAIVLADDLNKKPAARRQLETSGAVVSACETKWKPSHATTTAAKTDATTAATSDDSSPNHTSTERAESSSSSSPPLVKSRATAASQPTRQQPAVETVLVEDEEEELEDEEVDDDTNLPESQYDESLDIDINIPVPKARVAKYMLRDAEEGNRDARRIMKPFQEESVKIVKEFSEDPHSQLFTQMPRRRVIKHYGVYAIVDENGKIVKNGYSKNLVERRDDFYVKVEGLHPDRFVVIFDLDSVDDDVDEKLRKLYDEANKALLDYPDLPSFQKHFLRQQYERGGNMMGGRSTFVLQTVECGFQGKFGTPSQQEYLTGDPEVEQNWYNDSAHHARVLYGLMPEAVRSAGKKGTLKVLLISSWKPGGDDEGLIYVTVSINECIVDKDRWRNTLPNPVFPNAKTGEEIYCIAFPIEELVAGLGRLFEWLDEILLSDEPSLTIVDTNHLLFTVPNCPYRNIYEALTQKYNLQRQRFDFMDNQELVPYVDKRELHSLVVNRPFGVASDARAILMELRVQRSLSSSVCQNAVRLVEGKPVLDASNPDDEYQNPINGCLSFQMVVNANHSFLMSASAHFKDSCTPKNVNALKSNRIPKLSSLEKPLSRVLRKTSSNEAFRDRRLGIKFRSRVCDTPNDSPQNLQSLFDSALQLAKRGASNAASVRNRLLNVMVKGQTIASSALSKGLTALWKQCRDNVGNASARKCSDEEVKANNEFLPRFIQRHSQSDTQDAIPFWVRKDSKVPVLESLTMAGDHVEYEVLNALTYYGLETRLNERDETTSTYNNVKAIKFGHLGLYLYQPKQSRDDYILVQLLPRNKKQRSEEEQKQMWNDFMPRHMPQGDQRGKQFWMKTKGDVKEVDRIEMDDATKKIVGGGDYEREVYNGHPHQSLNTRIKRMDPKLFSQHRYKRTQKAGDYIIKQGYYLISLTPPPKTPAKKRAPKKRKRGAS